MAAEGARVGRRRRIVPRLLVAAVVVAALVVAGVLWFGRNGSGASYRTATVTRASVAQTLTSVGTVSSARKFSAAFPVSGTVATVPVALGQHVLAGQRLARLDTTGLAQQVDSAKDTVSSAKQTLADARDGQLSASQSQSALDGTSSTSDNSGSGLHADVATAVPLTSVTRSSDPAPSSSASPAPSASGSGSAPRSAAPSSGATSPGSSGSRSTGSISQLQQQVIAQQQRIDADLLTLRGPDGSSGELAQANACTADAGADCSTLLQQVATLENTIATEQTAQQQYEAALNQAIAAQSSRGSGSGSSKPGSSKSGSSKSGPSSGSAHSGSSGSGTPRSAQSGDAGTSGRSGQGSSGSSSTTAQPASAAQLAAYQVHVDAGQAELTLARQNLAAATLTSPLSGTVADVSLATGDQVSAGSSTQAITVIGPGAELVDTTVTLADITLVKVGQSVSVQVDGASSPLTGTVSRIGVLDTTTGSSTSFPVTVQLAAESPHVLDGVSAGVTITVATAHDVLTVPTSAVHALGALHTVTVLQAGKANAVRVGIAAMGAIRTEITSGLSVGQQVVLADLDEPLPTNDTTGRGFGSAGLARAQFTGGAGVGGGGPGGVTFNRAGN